MASDSTITDSTVPTDWASEGRRPSAPRLATPAARWTSGAVAAAAFLILAVAWVLEPDPNGLGTHRQLGLPECGWVQAANLPCPSCGMTTAFSHAAHGDFPGAFVAQPMGLILAVVAGVAVLAGLYTAATGSMLGPFLASFLGSRLLWIALVLALFAWIWKIASHRGLI